jgi:hypothetical protein
MVIDPYCIRNGPQGETNILGALLSLEIDCPIRLANNNSQSFVCKHGVLFQSRHVQYAATTHDWSEIRKRHDSRKD